jgi:hypothetical protein
MVDVEPQSPTARQVVREIDLDHQPGSTGPAPSPYTLLRSPDGQQLWVTLSAGNGIMVLDGEDFSELARVPTGNDPRGLVVLGDRLVTYPWLDNRLEVFSQPDANGAAEQLQTLDVGDDPTPSDVKAGQRIFNAASFSGNADFSCNNCHIDGLTDGLVWNILADGNVNTLAFRNVAGSDPFLWGGLLPTLFDFSREVLRLVGAEATGRQMDQLTRYMQSVTAPPNPYTLPGGRLTEAGRWGQILFEGAVDDGGAGCVQCHGGPLFTSQQTVRGKTDDRQTDVAGLIGVYDTGPWGREGSWTRLEAMVDRALDYNGVALPAGARDALVAYVRQLPGDVLYLNAAKPLRSSRHVPASSPVELTFSARLADDQADAFSLIRRQSGDAVEGEWVLSGRVARFLPTAGGLDTDTDYLVRVDTSLEGALGARVKDEITLPFTTGGVPEFDITGHWDMRISGPVSGTLVIAFLQAEGGRFSGTVLDGVGAVEVDHFTGFVVGRTMVFDPFIAIAVGMEFSVRGEAALTPGERPGFADRATGVMDTGFIDLDMELVRTGYPPEPDE